MDEFQYDDEYQPLDDGFIDMNGNSAGYKPYEDQLFDNPSDFDSDEYYY